MSLLRKKFNSFRKVDHKNPGGEEGEGDVGRKAGSDSNGSNCHECHERLNDLINTKH